MHAIDLRWFSPVVIGILYGLLAMVMHEIGHLCVAQALGLRVKNVGMSWKGMYTVREAGPPEKNLQVSLGGPLTNLALMALWPAAPVFGLANFFMGTCNLLPIPGSDGQRVLRCLRQMRETRKLSQQPRAMCRTSLIAAQDTYAGTARRSAGARSSVSRESETVELSGSESQRELSATGPND